MKLKKDSGQSKQETTSLKEARFHAATCQFVFPLVRLLKTPPDTDKSKEILRNISLSFYPGVKIDDVELNEFGKM